MKEAGLRYITALTDPQIGRLLGEGTLQMGWFSEQVGEVEADGVRYLLRKNQAEAAREQHRLEDQMGKLQEKIEQRTQRVQASPRCRPEAAVRQLPSWIGRHKPAGLVTLQLQGRKIDLIRNEAAITQSMELAGGYVVTTEVPKEQLGSQAVHDSYVGLQKVERDFRTLKTGLLEVRPVFVRKESRTRGHVFSCLLALKIGRELERRLRTQFGTTDSNPHAVTLSEAMVSLSRLCLLHYPINDSTTITRLPTPDAPQKEILAALAVALPEM